MSIRFCGSWLLPYRYAGRIIHDPFLWFPTMKILSLLSYHLPLLLLVAEIEILHVHREITDTRPLQDYGNNY